MSTETRAPRVLVFDSGVGGLSVAAEIRRRLPGCVLSYASDNAAFPYGTKSEAELVERVDRVLRVLVDRVAPEVIVVACNSASTLALPHIRAHFATPIVGVVPAIKPAAARSQTGVIGLLATPGTVTRPYTRDLIEQFAPDCTVIALGSAELVTLAEAHLRGRTPSPETLRDLLSPLREHPRGAEMDTLVLACTHFPLLRPQLQAVVGPTVTLVDSGAAIARRVAYWLDERARVHQSGQERHQALFTRDTEDVASLRPALERWGLQLIEVVAV